MHVPNEFSVDHLSTNYQPQAFECLTSISPKHGAGFVTENTDYRFAVMLGIYWIVEYMSTNLFESSDKDQLIYCQDGAWNMVIIQFLLKLSLILSKFVPTLNHFLIIY